MAKTINLLSAEYSSAGYLHIVWERFTLDQSPGFYADLSWLGGSKYFRIYDPKAVSCLMAVKCNQNVSYKVKLYALESPEEYDESTGSQWVPVTFI